MKKVLFVTSTIFLSIALGLFIVIKYKVRDIQKENIKIEKEIKELNTNYNSIKEENSLYEEKLSNIKKENEEIIEEEELWKETKQKIEDSLS